ncbi:hypothetical protein LTR78_004522 [Recurvomyces mirabilis]|uniref:Major facilitator superfamily (MFS) profile domain-containing protein n=2 Tax=Recurvomyces mirabilis TaxID=574656 RepID=A0AAE0WP64_9PEZI|nr:hypothetical protein LTR78_004522 [Recurvomyces mirabilis]
MIASEDTLLETTLLAPLDETDYKTTRNNFEITGLYTSATSTRKALQADTVTNHARDWMPQPIAQDGSEHNTTTNGHVHPTERTPLMPAASTLIDPLIADAESTEPNGHLGNGVPNSHINSTSNGTTNGHPKPRAKIPTDQHTAAAQSLTRTRALLTGLSLALLIFLQATNISLLTTTQSNIASDLQVYDKTTWFTSSFLITMSALSPLNGKLATIFQPRWCIFASSLILAIGAGICSIARNFTVFVAGRAMQGVGASGVFTISIVIVLELSGSKRRGIAIGLLNSGYTVGVALGAVLAGALVDTIGWRALFWLQAPVAVIGGIVLLAAIPHDFRAGSAAPNSTPKDAHNDGIQKPTPTPLQRLASLDYLGAATLTTTLILLLYSLSSPSGIPLLPLLLSGLVLTTFILNELYLTADPIIPLTLLRSRGLLLTCLGTLGYMLARWTVLFYTPTYALAVRGWSPATAGSILIPTNAGFALGGLAVGWLHITRPGSYWLPCVIVYALFPITLLLLAGLCTENSSPVLFVLVVGACGAVTGAALNYTLAHLLHLTPKRTHYIATSLLATFRGFAGSFGSAIGGGIFTRRLYSSLESGFAEHGFKGREDLVRRLLGSPGLVRGLQGVEKEVAIKGYEDALRTLFLAGAGLALVTVIVQAGTGWKQAKEDRVTAEEEEDEQEARQALLSDEREDEERRRAEV